MFFHKHFGQQITQQPRALGQEPADRERAEHEDIRRNLGWLLSSVRGITSFQPALGLSDATHRPSSGLLEQLRKEILENIERYEPRLEVITIEEEWDEDAERPYLRVEGRIKKSDARLRLLVDANRRELALADHAGDADERG
ncbi:MAG: hypothetical protein JWN04_6630 [Myxococcaceae bacterium]|nr:hypothetical protein [Myxococcaceae bacterium]